MIFLPQPPSSCSADPLNCTVLCSSIMNSKFIVNEDQDIDRDCVAQLTFIFIHEEYDWELEHQSLVKDDSLLFEHPPFFPDIFGDSAIHDFTCVSPFTDAPIVDHLQNTIDVSPSSDNVEDKVFTKNPLDFSSTFSRSVEGEFVHFSSTPLFDSSDHNDVDEIIDFSDCRCRDLFTPVFDHDDDYKVVDFSKTLVYDDLFFDEVETPQIVEALQPELMVMSGPCCFEVGFTSNQGIFEAFEAPHHSSVCIEYQFDLQIMLLPLELHRPIAHALEESYIERTCA